MSDLKLAPSLTLNIYSNLPCPLKDNCQHRSHIFLYAYSCIIKSRERFRILGISLHEESVPVLLRARNSFLHKGINYQMCRHVQNSRNTKDVCSYTICDLSTVKDAIYITKTSILPLYYSSHFRTLKIKSHFIRVSTKHHTRLLSQLILAVCVKERDFRFPFSVFSRSFFYRTPFFLSWVARPEDHR
jgi:hypothetical protein